MLLSSALHNIGSDAILNFLAEIFPSPAFRGKPQRYKTPDQQGRDVERKIADSEPVSLFVFKTVADPFAGRINYFKVMSGVLKNDATLTEFQSQLAGTLAARAGDAGQNGRRSAELHAGDIGAIAKLKETTTGDTLGDKNRPIFYPPARIPEPSITFAIEPKTRADEDRIGVAIHKILEEDLALRFGRDPQTKEFLLSGAGQQHIEVVVAKLRKRYHVELDASSAEGSVSRDDSRQGGRRRQAQEADGRARPVRRVPHQDGAAAARKGNRVRGRCFRRRDSEELDSVGRKGYSRFGGARLPGGLSGGGFPREPVRRQISRRGFERHGVQDCRIARVQGSDEAGAAGAARTDHARGEFTRRTNIRAT